VFIGLRNRDGGLVGGRNSEQPAQLPDDSTRFATSDSANLIFDAYIRVVCKPQVPAT
jgi:hypothetical protein